MEMGELMIGQVKDLKEGKYVVIDGVPCRVVEAVHSKPGKHGGAKARIVAIGLFNGEKKNLMKPVDANCEIPIVERRVGQIIADLGESIQVMDSDTYETFEMKKPTEEDMKVQQGQQVEYMKVMGQRKIMRAKSE